MALLYSTLSVFPIIEVASWRIFALKIITVILVANVIWAWDLRGQQCEEGRWPGRAVASVGSPPPRLRS